MKQECGRGHQRSPVTPCPQQPQWDGACSFGPQQDTSLDNSSRKPEPESNVTAPRIGKGLRHQNPRAEKGEPPWRSSLHFHLPLAFSSRVSGVGKSPTSLACPLHTSPVLSPLPSCVSVPPRLKTYGFFSQSPVEVRCGGSHPKSQNFAGKGRRIAANLRLACST